jgi:hypothetical protein
MQHLILITYQSYQREIIPFSLAALRYIATNQGSIVDIEMIEYNDLTDTKGE